MPFFSKPCFKFRKNKKKNKKKEDYYMKTFNDTIIPISNEETHRIIHRPEVKSRSSLKEDDTLNDLNHLVATNASNDTVSVTSQRAPDNDFYYNTDTQNSKTSVDNIQSRINAESHLIAQDKNSFDKNVLSADTVNESVVSNIVINEQNVNKLQEATKNEIAIIMEDLPDPEANNFREKMYIQKSIEIINSITVNSDVFEKMEELKALEIALNTLQQKIREEESMKNVEIGDTEHVNCDSHKIIKISDSHGSLDKEIHTSPYCSGSSTVSEEKNVAMTDVPVPDELNDGVIKIDSKCSFINSLDENQKVPAYSSTLPTEISVNENIETGDKKILHVSKQESHDSNNSSKTETENFSANLTIRGKEDIFDTTISMVSLVENNETLPINKTVIFDSDSNNNKSENMIQTKIEKKKSEENNMNKDFVAESAEMYNSDSSIKTHVVQGVETFDVKQKTNYNDYQTSECENEKIFQDDKEIYLTDSKSVEDECDDHHIENDSLKSESDHAITKSESLSLNTIQSNVEEGSDLKSCSDSCELSRIYSDKTKCIINSISDINRSSSLKAQNHYSENDATLVDKEDDFMSEKVDLEHFEEIKVDSNSKDSLCDLKALQNENILHKETENKSVPDLNESIASDRMQTRNKYGSEHYLNDNCHRETFSDYTDESSSNKAGEFATSPEKKQPFDSPRNTTKKPSIPLELDDILNNSEESLYVNVEYCKDDNIFSEDSEENKCQSENLFQSQESSYSSQDGVKCQEEHSSFLHFNEECEISNPKISGQNETKKLDNLQKGFDSYYENKEEIDDNMMSLKYKENDDKTLSKFMDSSKICKQLDKKEQKNRTADDTTLEKEISNKLSSNNLLQKQDLQLSSDNKRRKKFVSKYSLSDCSISSDSSNLRVNEDVKEEKLKAKSSDSFIFTEMGDSGNENSRENRILLTYNKDIQNSQKNTKLKHALRISKKKIPKMRKGDKIKISITKKCPSTDKDKISKTSCNDKYTSNTNRNTVRLQSGDAINFLSYFDKNDEDSELNRLINSKHYKTPHSFRTSFSINDRDAIEIKRMESLNLFNKRKQNILSQMGPNLRIIPIKKIENFKNKSSKIEKFCLNTELNSLTERDFVKRFSLMRKETSSSRKNVTVQNVVVPVEFLSESDTEALNENLGKMTPIRRKILDSSRSIRSPKYLSFSCKGTDNKNTYPLKPIFIKSPKQKIVVAHLSNDEKDIYELKESYKIYSPDSIKNKIVSPQKDSTEYSPRPGIHHTQNYRATSPDNLKSKFDDVFKRYARRGRCNGELISYKRSTEWLRDAGVIGKVLTADEATDVFKCVAGVKIALNKRDYRCFLEKLTRLKKLNYNKVYEKLCEAPTRSIVA